MSISDVGCQAIEQFGCQDMLRLSRRVGDESFDGDVNPQSDLPQPPSSPSSSVAAITRPSSPLSLLTSRTSPGHRQRAKMHWDTTRTFHVGITGLMFTGPISHTWYRLLERIMSTANRRADRYVGLFYRLVLDAVIFSPVAVAGYFTFRTYLEQPNNVGAITTKLQTKWSDALVASWSFWPLANVVYV